MGPAVKIKNLSISLDGKVNALNGINLEFLSGGTIGIIGPSGAGKTTLIRSIVGRLKPIRGEIIIFDEPAGSPGLRKVVTYMTQELSIYPDLTVEENLNYFAKMLGQPRKQIKTIVAKALADVGMMGKAASLAGNLSGGQKQRVSLAVALIGSPRLMVLDEPTVGLDPVLREKLWKLFADLAARGTTLIISSHSMDEAARCDHLVLIREGKVIAQSSPSALLERMGTKTVEESFLKLVGSRE